MVSTCAAQPSEGIWHLVSYSLNIFFPMSSYPLQAAGTDIPLSVLHCWLKLSLCLVSDGAAFSVGSQFEDTLFV